jgi:norsolorinic acid ketoreductase
VQTELGDAAAQAVGLGDHAPTTIQESCDGIMHLLAKASKKDYGGRLVVYTGEFSEW